MSTNPEMAFNDAGLCTGHVSTAVGLGRACVMDNPDHLTSPSGYLRIDLDVAADAGALRVWAWRGPIGTLYDNNAGTAAVADVRTLGIPTALEVTDDMRTTARKLRFDTTVRFTFQLVDANGDPVPKAGVEFSIGAEESRNGRSLGLRTFVKETGPDGSFEMEFYEIDQNPKSEDLGDIAQLDLDVLDSGMLKVIDRTTLGLLMDDGTTEDRLLDWSDEEAVVTSLTLTVPEQYLVASSEGAGAGSRAQAHLTDQYGSGMGGRESITFTSTDPSMTPNNINRTANVGGVATLVYRRDSESGGTETITARNGTLTAMVSLYWAARIPVGADGSGGVVVADPANNRAVVVSGDDVWLVEYSPADRIEIGAERVRISTFRDALTVGDHLAFQISPTGAANTYTLTNN